MDSVYRIQSPSQNVSMPLDEEQFRELKRARKRLSSAYAIRHKFRLVKTNYGLIAESLQTLGVAFLDDLSAEQLKTVKSRVNASVNNYILSGRTFTAQLKRHVQACLPQDRVEVNRLTRRMEIEYQRSFAYRFIDSLYDYVSYYGISVHSVEMAGKQVSANKNSRRSYSIKAFIERDYLGGPTDFRASVLKEMPARVELIELLDSFMDSLSRIYDLACRITDESTAQSHVLLREFINVFEGIHGPDIENLFVVHSVGESRDKIYDTFPISMYADQVNLDEEYR